MIRSSRSASPPSARRSPLPSQHAEVRVLGILWRGREPALCGRMVAHAGVDGRGRAALVLGEPWGRPESPRPRLHTGPPYEPRAMPTPRPADCARVRADLAAVLGRPLRSGERLGVFRVACG